MSFNNVNDLIEISFFANSSIFLMFSLASLHKLFNNSLK